jgi:hypothetical protein
MALLTGKPVSKQRKPRIMQGQTKQETCYFPIEIKVNKAGETVRLERALPLLFEKVKGATILDPGHEDKGGVIFLSIGGEEIFPGGFHAGTYMKHQPTDQGTAFVLKDIDSYMHEIDETAQGATVSVIYKEPLDGGEKTLFLLLKLIRGANAG